MDEEITGILQGAIENGSIDPELDAATISYSALKGLISYQVEMAETLDSISRIQKQEGNANVKLRLIGDLIELLHEVDDESL